MHLTLSRRLLLAASSVLALATVAMPASAQDTIKVGVLATLEGAFTVLGEDGMRGAELALQQHDAMAGGHKIEFITGSSDASPESAVRAARKLVEEDGVSILIGPLSGSEGIAVRDYAKTQPGVTFVNGTSAAQETTLFDPAPNFFRFSTDGVQWMAGLGKYAFETKGYQNVVTIAEDYSFPYSQVAGFMVEFCAAGGHVVDKYWVPIGNKDFSSIISALPDDIDAIYVALGGADAVNFLSQYEQAGGSAPMIGGSITVDQTVLGSKGRSRDIVIGTPSAGPIADNWDDPRWQAFVDAYNAAFPDAFPSPSLFAHGYYVNTLAVLTALDQVQGDLSNNQAALQEALATMSLDTPTGTVTLDHNRNAVADIFLTEVAAAEDGTLFNKVVSITPAVNQTLGVPEDQFKAGGAASRDNPACP